MDTINVNGKEYTRARIEKRIERIKEEREELQHARDMICNFAPYNEHTLYTDNALQDAYHKLGDDLKTLEALLKNK